MPTAARVAITFREIGESASDLRELARFYRRLYVAQFPDPNERESLANMKRYLRLKARGWYGKNNYHIVIGEIGGEPVGGAIFDFLAEPNAGVIEFLFVDVELRQRGLGKALLGETERILRADARSRLRRPLAGIVAEMNDPFKHASTPDNLDPFLRCAMWGKWGYYKIEFPYIQPALSRQQEPVDNLVLIAKPIAPRLRKSCDAGWTLNVVAEYMRWAMRITDPHANPQHREMAEYLGKRLRVPLTKLGRYVGRDPRRRLTIEEIEAGHRWFEPALHLLRREIPAPGRVCSTDQFRTALSRRPGRRSTYHLWGIRTPASGSMEGVASFFALSTVGFGGYIVLAGTLRGRGLLRQVIARIEEQMIRNGTRAAGWFIECDAKVVPIFRHMGFSVLSLDYRPPPVGEVRKARQNATAEPLNLLYKPFGCVYAPPRLRKAFVLNSLASILKHVYGIERPGGHACYLRAKKTLQLTGERWVAIAD